MSGMLCADNTYYVSPVFTAHLCKVCAYPIKEVSMHIYIYGILVVEFQDSFWNHRIRSFFIRSLLVIFNHEFRSSGEPPPDKMGLRIWCRCELVFHRLSTPRALTSHPSTREGATSAETGRGLTMKRTGPRTKMKRFYCTFCTDQHNHFQEREQRQDLRDKKKKTKFSKPGKKK